MTEETLHGSAINLEKHVIGHVKTDVRAQEIMEKADQLGIKIIIGMEPADTPEDLRYYYNDIKIHKKHRFHRVDGSQQ